MGRGYDSNRMIRPGMFGRTVAADARRVEFDFLNEQVLHMGTGIDYLFIGDSITQLWNLNVYFQPDKHLENRGIGGDTSTYLLKRFDADCTQLHPKHAVIMIGANDISRTEEDLWWHTPGEAVEDVLREYQANMRQVVEKCKASHIDAIVCSVTPSKIAPPFNRTRRWEMTACMNECLRSLGTIYIDYHSALSEDGGSISQGMAWDGMHPSAEAYYIMASKLAQATGLKVKDRGL